MHEYISWNLISYNILVFRDNKTKILEFLHDAWAKDRKAEWSIWMVYSKVEMPHHYINSGVHRRVSSLWKLPDEVNTWLFLRIRKDALWSWNLVKKNLVQITKSIFFPLNYAASSDCCYTCRTSSKKHCTNEGSY